MKRSSRFSLRAVVLFGGIVGTATSHAYVPCAGVGTVGGQANTVATFTVGEDEGAICSRDHFDLGPRVRSEFWLEVQNNSEDIELCSVTIYTYNGPTSSNPRQDVTLSLFGSTPIQPRALARVVNTTPAENTTMQATQINRTIGSLTCQLFDPGTGGGGGGGTPPPPNDGHLAGDVELLPPFDYSIDFDAMTADITAYIRTWWDISVGQPDEQWIELWATTTPYIGNGISGYRLTSCQLWGQATGACADRIHLSRSPAGGSTVSYSSYENPLAQDHPLLRTPPAGTYYVSVLVMSRRNCPSSEPCIAAGASMNQQLTVSAPPPAPPPPPAPSPTPPPASPPSSPPPTGGDGGSNGAGSGSSGGGGGGAIHVAVLALLLSLSALDFFRRLRVRREHPLTSKRVRPTMTRPHTG